MRILAAVFSLSCVLAVPSGAVPTLERAPPTQRQAPDDAAVQRAVDFLAELEDERMTDKAYAERLLKEVDVLRASDHYVGEARDATDMLRLLALWVLERKDEALAAADATTANGGQMREIYKLSIQVAGAYDAARAVTYLERADKYLVTAEQREAFKAGLDDDGMWSIRRALYKAKDKPAPSRWAEGLLKFDWPGEAVYDGHNLIRYDAIDGRLARKDVVGARALASQIGHPATALEMLVLKDYDALFDVPDRGAHLAQLIAAEDIRSARALAAKPDDRKQILLRAQFLRSAGREAEALALLLPHSADMAAVAKGGADSFWLVNEASYALRALGRGDEAMALMKRLLALGLDKHPDLINMAINSTLMMNRVGQYRDGAAYAEELFRKHADKASPFGHMWMWEAAACGHALSGNLAAAKPWMARLRAAPDANRAALMRGLLCTNDLDGAATQFIERLNGDNPGAMMTSAQDYSIINDKVPESQILDQRLRQVVARPAVAAAIARKGRILKLPLSRAYWGQY